MAAVLPEKRMSLDSCARYGARQPGIPGEELFERLLLFKRLPRLLKVIPPPPNPGAGLLTRANQRRIGIY
ncbi:hypothetical protein [Paenibacillus apii]|uniref:hypothetical protein n=1 Tax=Paenibacillus apii TaxID=1850370 RepID=UPI00143C11A4|nr:hypothetical protein [Paenibacillus apii]NJJ41300.1 hypothetical protein [Paenibacillus apii]